MADYVNIAIDFTQTKPSLIDLIKTHGQSKHVKNFVTPTSRHSRDVNGVYRLRDMFNGVWRSKWPTSVHTKISNDLNHIIKKVHVTIPESIQTVTLSHVVDAIQTLVGNLKSNDVLCLKNAWRDVAASKVALVLMTPVVVQQCLVALCQHDKMNGSQQREYTISSVIMISAVLDRLAQDMVRVTTDVRAMSKMLQKKYYRKKNTGHPFAATPTNGRYGNGHYDKTFTNDGIQMKVKFYEAAIKTHKMLNVLVNGPAAPIDPAAKEKSKRSKECLTCYDLKSPKMLVGAKLTVLWTRYVFFSFCSSKNPNVLILDLIHVSLIFWY